MAEPCDADVAATRTSQRVPYLRGVPDPDPPYPEQPTDEVRTHEIGNRTYVVANVDPLDVDGTRTVAVGSVLFLVAFVLLLPFYGRLEDAGRTWWLWTCLAGFGLGVIGWDYCRRRRNRRQAREGA
jgi:Protein of unknown function (DUF2530)